MFKIKKPNVTEMFRQLRMEGGVSMRRRFVVYIVSAIVLAVSLIVLLLHVFGILNLTNGRLTDELETKLTVYADEMERDYDKQAAYALSLAEQLAAQVQAYLEQQHLHFADLENNPDAVTQLQVTLYDTLYLHMQLAPSSGAFYILDTTVNSHSETPLYNGIYLKYINLYSESTVNNDFSLYRGSYTTGKYYQVSFHSGWQNEMRTDFFADAAALFPEDVHYRLSPPTAIPDTWETARYLYVPIRDRSGAIIGVCGYEINDLFFQLMHRTNDSERLVYGLLEAREDGYAGQFSSSFCVTAEDRAVQLQADKAGTVWLDFGTERYLGKTKDITLGGDAFLAAVMLPEQQYDRMVAESRMKIGWILLIVVFFSFLCCTWMSRKYVSPIVRKIEQIKENADEGHATGIAEMDDLFDYLAGRDAAYEEQLAELETARRTAEAEANRLKAAYEQAMEEYQLAQSRLKGLSEGRKNEIVLEEYEYFVCNLGTLTPAEYRVYELYLEGKTAKEIIVILGITENTLKYHNRNIYSKLGISSRKQLLRYAALKKQQDEGACDADSQSAKAFYDSTMTCWGMCRRCWMRKAIAVVKSWHGTPEGYPLLKRNYKIDFWEVQ